MALTVDMIVRRFPEFVLVQNEVIEEAILEATIIMGDAVERWQTQEIYYMANQYLVGHLIVTAQATAGGDENALSPITRTSVDDVEVDYAAPTGFGALDAELASTSYGRRYLFYRGMVFTGGVLA